MARDFLSLSPSYIDSVSAEIRERRKTVISFLNDDYCMPRGGPAQAVENLNKDGFKANISTVSYDTCVYRQAWLWLAGNEKEKNRIKTRMSKRHDPEMIGVKCLIKDGVTAWEQLSPQAAETTALPPETETEDVIGVTKGQLVLLETGIGRICEEVTRLEAERGLLQEEVARLKSENETLQAAIRAGEDRLKSLREMKVENLADQFPQVAALLDLVTTPAAPQKKADPIGDLPDLAPGMNNREVKYSDRFKKELGELQGQQSNMRSVKKAVRNLCEYGLAYQGLKVRSIPTEIAGVKPGEGGYTIRASRKIRILYRCANGSVEFMAILSRGQMEYSER